MENVITKKPVVTIYSTPTCVYCKMAKDFFKEHNVLYEEKDVSIDQGARQKLIELSGQLGVPVIDIDGEIIVGFNQAKLAKILNIQEQVG